MIAATTTTVYQAFGLRIATRIPMPELYRLDAGSAEGCDVEIRFMASGELERHDAPDLRNENFIRRADEFWFYIPETAVYRIRGGRHIAVSPVPGADMVKVRVYLLGTCMGVLLLQRGTLPLHGSAVVIDGQAHAVVGNSGAGKSTLAAALIREGCRLLTDDVIPVAISPQGRPYVHPAYPQQKLWRQSLDQFGMEPSRYRPVYREVSKFAVPVTASFCEQSVPLAGIWELVPSQDDANIRVQPVRSLDRLKVVLLHTYRHTLVHRMDLAQWHFTVASGVAGSSAVRRLFRPASGFTAAELARRIIDTARKGERGEEE
ncbi:aldolase [Paenibacillus sp. 32O-W]|uniref:aldolase n=1 Tax=Paenibacillus sp. 32O-W TaxID=1695218 RepID=UPI0007221D52|nr:aldolase [Paenibacillus sp. 32O-W]ALS29700.1 aldolase [Paenibacillus sp. 32O-W]